MAGCADAAQAMEYHNMFERVYCIIVFCQSKLCGSSQIQTWASWCHASSKAHSSTSGTFACGRMKLNSDAWRPCLHVILESVCFSHKRSSTRWNGDYHRLIRSNCTWTGWRVQEDTVTSPISHESLIGSNWINRIFASLIHANRSRILKPSCVSLLSRWWFANASWP